jgi:hypothetical protein
MIYSYVKKLFVVFLLVTPSTVYAGGSTYSRYGFGDILRYGDSRLYALGGTGIALIDDGFINGLNPAGLARISFTRFSGGFEYNRFSSQDNNGSAGYSTGGFQGLSFAIPISKDDGIVLSFASTPYSAVRYAINSTYTDATIGIVKHQSLYGSGGLSNINIALSGSPLTTLHIGGRLNYLYGRTRQYQKSTYDNSDFAATTLDQSLYYSGFTFTLGAIYEDIEELLSMPSLHDLSVGAVLTTSSVIDAEEQSIFSSIDSTFSSPGTAEIPLSVGIGLSYLYKDQFRVLGDFVIENWATAKVYNSEVTDLRNSFRASLGFETVPSKDIDSFWKRNIYRAGFVLNSTYYNINGIGIDEYLISAGVGVPIGADSRLNIGLQAGMRGSTDNKLQKDTIFRLSVAISASELWFLKFDEE